MDRQKILAKAHIGEYRSAVGGCVQLGSNIVAASPRGCYSEAMVFDASRNKVRPGQRVYQDRFREIEIGVAFKKIVCSRCDFPGFYKYRVQQMRRRPRILVEEDEEVRLDHEEIWGTIPRFAEIPQTLKCKRCREVLGSYVLCVY